MIKQKKINKKVAVSLTPSDFVSTCTNSAAIDLKLSKNIRFVILDIVSIKIVKFEGGELFCDTLQFLSLSK